MAQIEIKKLPKTILIAVLVGVFAGTASAALLASLDFVTAIREDHLWLVALLPAMGFAIAWIYHRFGRVVEAGNNLILEEIHTELEEPAQVIPARMAPLILLGTIGTHLAGGSAGREGTALQMGASLADQLTKPFRLSFNERKVLLMTGLAAGFGSVFGVPAAGAAFGLEVIAIGKLKTEAILPCVLASFVGHYVTLACRIHHTHYIVSQYPPLSVLSLVWAAMAGVCFGVVGMLFAKTNHFLSHFFKQTFSYPPLRPVLGGIVVVALAFFLGSTKYLGLGIPTIVDSFIKPLPAWDFLGKLVFTAITLGSGYKGGEVTPLFFIGATLGNSLSYLLPLPTSLLAGLGFVAVFAGAANTPIASAVMAIELFGFDIGIYAFIACVVSYLCSGRGGIYRALNDPFIPKLRHKE